MQIHSLLSQCVPHAFGEPAKKGSDLRQHGVQLADGPTLALQCGQLGGQPRQCQRIAAEVTRSLATPVAEPQVVIGILAAALFGANKTLALNCLPFVRR